MKDGINTSEFWLTVLTMFGVLGLIITGHQDEIPVFIALPGIYLTLRNGVKITTVAVNGKKADTAKEDK